MRRPTVTRKPPTRGAMILALRETLIHSARALMEQLRPEWAGEDAVVTVEIHGADGQAVVRYPSTQ
jgi:hypothetical protein